jgi:hypothetical protein
LEKNSDKLIYTLNAMNLVFLFLVMKYYFIYISPKIIVINLLNIYISPKESFKYLYKIKNNDIFLEKEMQFLFIKDHFVLFYVIYVFYFSFSKVVLYLFHY